MSQPTQDAIAAAKAAQAKYGIPASIQLAQYALESAWGKTTAGDFNYWGMKALAGQPCALVMTHEVYKGKTVSVQCAFRKFGSAAESFDAHAKLLATGSPYAEFRAALPNITKACAALGGSTPQHPRYATDPAYGTKLMAIISGSNLTGYDKP